LNGFAEHPTFLCMQHHTFLSLGHAAAALFKQFQASGPWLVVMAAAGAVDVATLPLPGSSHPTLLFKQQYTFLSSDQDSSEPVHS